MELNPRKHLPNPNREATPRIPDADSRSALVISLFPNPLATIRSTSSSRLLALIGRTLGSADCADGAWERDDEVFPILGHLGICLQQEHVRGDRHLLRGRADLQLSLTVVQPTCRLMGPRTSFSKPRFVAGGRTGPLNIFRRV